MFLKIWEKLQLGFSGQSKQRVSLPVDSKLIENLRCHSSDEYPIVSADDESPIPPLACNFSRTRSSAHVLGLVDENGSVIVYDTNKAGDDAVITEWTAHNNAIFDVEWLPGEEKLLTASGDQSICLWDVTTRNKLLTCKGHTSSVRSVACRPCDNAVFVSGSRDGHARLWDTRCNIKDSSVSSVNVIRNAHTVQVPTGNKRRKTPAQKQTQDSQQSVTCVIFQNDHLLATAGAVDGCVKVWDLRKIKPDNSVPVYTFPYWGSSKRTHGYSCLTFDSHYARLFANCTDDVIYCYDFTTYREEPLCAYKGHRNTSFYVKAALSPDDQYLLSGSTDENAYIWEVEKPNVSPVVLTGHRSEISDVAWCKTDLFRLVTSSDDNSMRVWRFDPTAQIRKQMGQTDAACNITGAAKRTHRDIGVSADPCARTPKHASPHSSLKRSASAPIAGVLEMTPKRARTANVSSPSPSIKMWLKRGASDTTSMSTSAADGDKTEECTLKKRRLELGSDRTEDNTGSDFKELRLPSNGTIQDTSCTGVGTFQKKISPKKISVKPLCSKLEHGKETAEAGCENTSSVICSKDSRKYSCKRKLESSENSPDSKRRKTADEDSKSATSPPKVVSPRRKDNVLKEINPQIQCTPSKEKDLLVFSSPARSHLLNPHTRESPTSNLPNLVVDGPFVTTPSRKDEEGVKKKTVDWLTQMRIQKMGKSSPKSRSCSKKLLEKLNQQNIPPEAVQSRETGPQPGATPVSPRVKSPARGIQSITKFFRQPTI